MVFKKKIYILCDITIQLCTLNADLVAINDDEVKSQLNTSIEISQPFSHHFPTKLKCFHHFSEIFSFIFIYRMSHVMLGTVLICCNVSKDTI